MRCGETSICVSFEWFGKRLGKPDLWGAGVAKSELPLTFLDVPFGPLLGARTLGSLASSGRLMVGKRAEHGVENVLVLRYSKTRTRAQTLGNLPERSLIT